MAELNAMHSSASVPDLYSAAIQEAFMGDAYGHALLEEDDDDLFPFQQECDTLALADALAPERPESPFPVGSPFFQVGSPFSGRQVTFDDTPQMAVDHGEMAVDLEPMESHLGQLDPSHSHQPLRRSLELALSRSLDHDHELQLQPCASLKRAFSAGDIQEVLLQQAEAAAAAQPIVRSPHHRAGRHGGATVPKSRSMFDMKKFPSAKLSMHPGVRKWLKIDAAGDCMMVQIDKSRISARLGVQWRDLRIVDPKLATNYPSALLCRDKAMVVNLEYIKAIITTNYVLVSNLEHQSVLPFVEELKQKLSAPPLESMLEPADLTYAKPPVEVEGAAAAGPGRAAAGPAVVHVRGGPATAGPGSVGGASAVIGTDLELPFELRCLEACLEHINAYWDKQVRDLDTEARVKLDELTGKVNSEHLESLRHLKGRLNRCTTKVDTIREVLEKLLDDDKDMLAMNLSAKEASEAAALARQPSVGLPSPMLRLRLPQPRRGGRPHAAAAPSSSSSSSSSSSGSSMDSEEEAEIAEVEMLLESYFMQIDNTYNKLQVLKEYIDDTEDLINTELDFNFNQLIEVDLLLTAATCAVTLVSVMGAIFGQNLNSHLQGQHPIFMAVTLSAIIVATALFVCFFAASKYYQIIVNI